MKSDLDIIYENKMEPILKIGKKINLKPTDLELYGQYKAKISLDVLTKYPPKGKLILVTSINPTKAGEGKTTTTIGLADSMASLGKKTILALREPSYGPVLGQKGGATGGGYAQVQPMPDINLHFTGDMHAIGVANNIISALIDNHIYQGNELNINPEKVVWKRAIDLNDRTLREIKIGLGKKINGPIRDDGFNITVASEVMAILCLAQSMTDLRERLERIIIAYTYEDKPVTIKMLGCSGVLILTLKEAIKPNLAQTLYHTPAIIHGGPFANIAHGCNSVIATKMALGLADYVVTEAGFGADLGCEKFLNIKCQEAKLKPSVVIIVATIRALKLHSGKEDLSLASLEDLKAGIPNLEKHIETVKCFNMPYVIAINKFLTDSENEINYLISWSKQNNHPVKLSNVFAEGPEGGVELAQEVLALCNKTKVSPFQPLYSKKMPIKEKIELICKNVYGASGVDFNTQSLEKIKLYTELGFNDFYICMAKTPMSLTDDPKIVGRPKNFKIQVKDLELATGAGFIIVHCGNIMRMPGLPKEPAALKMDFIDNKVIGIF